MAGWIKLHRQLMNDDIFQNEKLLKIFIYCLLKASHQDRKQLVGLQTVDLSPGQFVFGRKKAAQELDMKESTVWKYMKFLEQVQTLSLNSNNKFTVVTVDKWGSFQDIDNKEEQQSNNKVTTKEQQNNTNKNVKNVKKDIKTSRPKLKFETHHKKLAELLFKKIKENNPNASEPNLNSWANTFRLMMERPKEKRTGKDIQDLILWSQSHDFWYKNILSADKLRKQFDRLQLEMNDERRKKPLSKSNGKTPEQIEHEKMLKQLQEQNTMELEGIH